MHDAIATILKGLRLLWAQTSWTAIAWMRQREIAALRSRLHDEYRRLGEAVSSAWKAGQALDPTAPDTGIALRQVDFLLDEIRHLEQALDEERQRFFQDKGLTPEKGEE